ncbi:hypothetical protein [Kineosporia sp. NBRC 101731]|uniref:hypothetical protein n=1 Tax=Kineosporia sp. NBRC 101731 TaxID=3032199 RepID=UPI002554FCBA|nr:hypothetical protein [Kineosporia sp. NBRC 101731]
MTRDERAPGKPPSDSRLRWPALVGLGIVLLNLWLVVLVLLVVPVDLYWGS